MGNMDTPGLEWCTPYFITWPPTFEMIPNRQNWCRMTESQIWIACWRKALILRFSDESAPGRGTRSRSGGLTTWAFQSAEPRCPLRTRKYKKLKSPKRSRSDGNIIMVHQILNSILTNLSLDVLGIEASESRRHCTKLHGMAGAAG